MPLRPPLFLRRAPPAPTLEWVAAAVGAGAGARVTSVRRLRGGMSAAVHALAVEDASGQRTRLVLRRFVRADWLAEEPDLAAHEATALRLLAHSDVPAPRLVAFDEHAVATDVPAVLMTRVAGGVELAPANLEAYVRAQAAMLPRIHATPLTTTASGALPAYRRYITGPDTPPPGAQRHEAWQALVARAAAPPPPGVPAFIHRDYHPGNVLWARGRLSGVVDWVNACVGAPAVDVGHARWNLAVLHGVEVADAFLGHWLTELGRSPSGTDHDPYWDIVCLLDAGDSARSIEDALRGWHDGGRTDLTLDEALRRRDAYAVSLARRL